jgi:hypothetical protein
MTSTQSDAVDIIVFVMNLVWIFIFALLYRMVMTVFPL